MHAIFSRRVVVCSSSQLKKHMFSRHFLSHLLPSGIFSSSSATSCFIPSLLSRSQKFHGFFASMLRNAHLKLKFGNLVESRVGFFGLDLPSKGFESSGFTGFQKRGWKSWINGGSGVVFGLIIANDAVFTMWRVSERDLMVKKFVLSTYSLMSGRIHTLITLSFSHIGITHFSTNMLGLCYFGTRIARTLGPLYLLKLYFAGALGGSVFFLSNHALMATSLMGAGGPLFAIMLLDIFLYPKITTYFGLMLRAHVMAGVIILGTDMLKMLEGQENNMSSNSGQLGGIAVAAMAQARLRKDRLWYH